MPPTLHPKTIYLLDTNILIHAVRGGAVWERIKAACNPLMAEPRPSICIVSDGELRSFAHQNNWGDFKQNQTMFLLDYFARAQIDALPILELYAEIDTGSRRHSVRMGKNDLWIAAVAAANNLTLVTTDRDFDHLHGVFLSRLYINPAL